MLPIRLEIHSNFNETSTQTTIINVSQSTLKIRTKKNYYPQEKRAIRLYTYVYTQTSKKDLRSIPKMISENKFLKINIIKMCYVFNEH